MEFTLALEFTFSSQHYWSIIKLYLQYIPLKQWSFDDSHSPKYQRYKIDQLPRIISFQQEWNWKDLIPYYQKRYHKTLRPVFRRVACDIPSSCRCPACDAPVDYLMWNDGKKKSQVLCKVCQSRFSPTKDNRFSKNHRLNCPHYCHSLVPIKSRKHFIIHKCVNPKCSYYLYNLKKIEKNHLDEEHGKIRYKLHYIYREFTIDFFKMDLSFLLQNASSLRFTKFDSHVMSLCLTYRVNLGLSLRKTSQALKDIHNISISHQSVANYCTTAALCVKPLYRLPSRKENEFKTKWL